MRDEREQVPRVIKALEDVFASEWNDIETTMGKLDETRRDLTILTDTDVVSDNTFGYQKLAGRAEQLSRLQDVFVEFTQ